MGTIDIGAFECETLVPGDTDRDGDVDSVDLATLALNWAPVGTDKTWGQGNFSADNGNVDAVRTGLELEPAGGPYSSASLGA
ncbi:MAG: hypothetical protein J7M14_03360 [Planctomycetes bacterium]|nr:hypothetical protein [Planctomycetota bacterium]